MTKKLISMICLIGALSFISCTSEETPVDETPVKTDAQSVTEDTAALDFADFTFNGENETSVTQDFSVPTSGSNGTAISWSSDNASVSLKDSAATVTQPSTLTGDITVTLTATIEKNGVSETKDFTITITAREPVAADQVTYTAGVSFNMRYVPGGLTTPTGTDDSGTATVSNGYLMGETEVTYELWYAVYTWATHADRGANIYTFANAGREGHDGTIGGIPVSTEPVTAINWRDAMVFSNALTEYYNVQNGTSLEPVYYSNGTYTTPQRDSSDANCGAAVGSTAGDCDNPYIKAVTDSNQDMVNCIAKGFRLPTSDEWELAARYKGSDSANGAIEEPASSGNWWTPGSYASGATAAYTDAAATGLVAWYIGNGGSVTHNVAAKTANALGLYDMSGNVWEWAFDWYTPGFLRVYRGGSCNLSADFMQVGGVIIINPYYYNFIVGFRLSRTP